MTFDDYSLENTLQRTAGIVRASHPAIMKLASTMGPPVAHTLAADLDVRRSFLGGSMVRRTWGEPRREIDLFMVLGDRHRSFLDSPPSMMDEQLAGPLRLGHLFMRPKGSRRNAVQLAEGRDEEPTARMAVLPAFEAPRGIIFPDQWSDQWIQADPYGLGEWEKSADAKLTNWRDLARFVKAWNFRDERYEPYVKPSLLLEVMTMNIAKELPLSGIGTQLAALFQMLYRRIDEEWPDPGGVAPPLTSTMSAKRRAYAKAHLQHAWLTLSAAMRADARDDFREAKRLARSVLGKIVSIAPRDEYGDLLEAGPFVRVC